ncbi:MAG: hypothetical protein QHH04_03660 [Methanolinea sp.]|nr:hypothetical protein [Methanolinea sp.]
MNRMEGNCPGPQPIRTGLSPLKARTPGVRLHHLFRIKTVFLLGITPLDAAGQALMHRRETAKGGCSSRTRDSR